MNFVRTSSVSAFMIMLFRIMKVAPEDSRLVTTILFSACVVMAELTAVADSVTIVDSCMLVRTIGSVSGSLIRISCRVGATFTLCVVLAMVGGRLASLVSAPLKTGSSLQRNSVSSAGFELKFTSGIVSVSIVIGGNARLIEAMACVSGRMLC